ncbi:MAG: 1-deoxy-D-xylulose-5-phosphate synthase [Lachnospiraceae bacterium]|nr:1-deoxy-D-xylulose-5-phosphate synthase [Lachnospiraceae bacterium]
MILDRIQKANDIKQIKPEEYEELAREIRRFLVDKVSKTGGHLASNLGAVELTMALHICLNLPKDKIVWDVGHQSYVHKILTGRKDMFDTLRQYGGLSGFPKRRESEYDTFNTGHSSTSISAALGLVVADEQINGNDSTIVAVIGDGAMTGGMAQEAINNASKLKRNFIIILNDNEMSISQNVGGFSTYLSNARAGNTYIELKSGVQRTLEKIPGAGDKIVRSIKRTKHSIKQLLVPGMLFENLGITYLGPVDGHNTNALIRIINEAKNIDHAVLIHVCTKKGKGYGPAMEDPSLFHGIGPFNPRTGLPDNAGNGKTYTDIFADAIIREADKNEKINAITAAMADGTGLVKFQEKFPRRFFDVGIAEEHAVTFAAGLAVGGLKPFVAIYSSFLQRAYDQILHDVCIQNLPVTFCIDRAGLVGNDGETHQGIFDISYLSSIPNMNILAPKNAAELDAAITFAASFPGPLAIRYPRGRAYTGLSQFDAPICFGKSEVIYLEKDIAILSVGTMAETAVKVRNHLKEHGWNVTLVNARFVKPIDEEMIDSLLSSHRYIITLEENVINGGYGMAVLRYINNLDANVKVINFAIPNSYVEQGSKAEQLKECGLDPDSITAKLDAELL